jgi:hypothetical protein
MNAGRGGGPAPQQSTLCLSDEAALFGPIFCHESAPPLVPPDFPLYPGSGGGGGEYGDYTAAEAAGSGHNQQQENQPPPPALQHDSDLSVLSSDLINRVLDLPYVVINFIIMHKSMALTKLN